MGRGAWMKKMRTWTMTAAAEAASAFVAGAAVVED